MVEPLTVFLASVAAGIAAKIVALAIEKWIEDKPELGITVKLADGIEITLSKDQQSVAELHKKVEALHVDAESNR